MNNTWIKVEDINVSTLEALQGQEILGFNKLWIDEDFNPKGTRVCFKTDSAEDGWCSAKWLDCHDDYTAIYQTSPTHIYIIPETKNLQ